MPVTTLQTSGERCGVVLDPSGNVWWISTRFDAAPHDATRWVAAQRDAHAS